MLKSSELITQLRVNASMQAASDQLDWLAGLALTHPIRIAISLVHRARNGEISLQD